jgi:hypothetical protein
MRLSQGHDRPLVKDRTLTTLSTEYVDYFAGKSAKLGKSAAVKAVNGNSIIVKGELSHFSVDKYPRDPVHCR